MSKELLVGVVIGASLKAGFATVFGRAEQTVKALGSEIKNATKMQEQFGRALRARQALNPTHNLAKESRAYAELSMSIKRATVAQNNLNQALAKQASARQFRANLRSEMTETAAHAAVVTGPVIGAVKKFMEQEDASADLKISMMRKDGSFGKFEEIDRLATQWGAALPGNKTDFTNMVKDLKSQGISDDTIINGGGLATAQLNVVMDIPISDGSFFAKNMEAHGIKESELLPSADLTQRAYFAAGLSKENMFGAMKYYAPLTNILGYTGLEHQKKIYAVEGMAATKGVEDTQFGTNFASFLTRLSKGPANLESAKTGTKGKLKNMMQDAGAEFNFFNPDGTIKDLREITGILETEFGKIKAKYGDKGVMDISDAMFGPEGNRVASNLIQQGVKGFDEMIAKMDDQASIHDRIKVKTNTLSSAFEALGGVAENTAAIFGGIFAEDLKGLATGFQNLMENHIAPFIQNNKAVIKWLLGLAGGFLLPKWLSWHLPTVSL
ncbi:phage tail tape measure protein [Neisseria animalis]|uniref:Phage tail tape measure protein n=1 Tax=Neisseria animalis TaxID=492 RepID=A0A5P3MPS5_NEIAN|nr:phage tail tape measure protein [Neisseria animalis]QEY23553.1 phage tail tape measure protein [Neisseria animalis]ROW32153.1 phage tail tape measure protein [Neisseria animalis]VEE09202.1 phage tail related protein [Neisseria animalis]